MLFGVNLIDQLHDELSNDTHEPLRSLASCILQDLSKKFLRTGM